MCKEWKDAMMEKMMEMKIINLQRADFKDTVEKWKNDVTGLHILLNFITTTQSVTQ